MAVTAAFYLCVGHGSGDERIPLAGWRRVAEMRAADTRRCRQCHGAESDRVWLAEREHGLVRWAAPHSHEGEIEVCSFLDFERRGWLRS